PRSRAANSPLDDGAAIHNVGATPPSLSPTHGSTMSRAGARSAIVAVMSCATEKSAPAPPDTARSSPAPLPPVPSPMSGTSTEKSRGGGSSFGLYVDAQPLTVERIANARRSVRFAMRGRYAPARRNSSLSYAFAGPP